MAVTLPVIWKTPFTTITALPTLGLGLGGDVFAISPDGTKAYGICAANDGSRRAVRWNLTTLAITELFRVHSPDSTAFAAASDGSIIVGCGSAQAPQGGAINAQPIIRWAAGGTSGAVLPPNAGGGTVSAVWIDWTIPQGLCSDDGSVIVGTDTSQVAYAATKWANGVNITLPGLGTGGLDHGAQANCVSADGAYVIGTIGNNGATQTSAGFWSGINTLNTLPIPSIATGIGQTDFGATAYYCNSDASIAWGECYDIANLTNTSCYWTSVHTGGTSHVMDQLTNTQHQRNDVYAVAVDPGAGVAVGMSPKGSSGIVACKWNGTTATDLGSIDPGVSSIATGCNSAGDAACGWSYDASFTQWAVRWDNSNTLHVLPSLADPSDSFQGIAYGMSRDGSVIFGSADFGVPFTNLRMDNVRVVSLKAESLCTSGQPPSPTANFYLRWSDTRGATWGNPVPQEFSSSPYSQPQWNRTGYARDRVFELFWSAAYKTAVNGAFVDVFPLKT